MKRTVLAAMAMMLALGLGAGLSGEARALVGGGLVVENSGASALQPVHFKKKHHKHHHHKKKHHHKKHHHKHHNGGFVIQFGNVFGAPYYNGGPQYAHRDCHRVVKKGYFNGRYAKIGGTQCYDRYGNAYIVEGSRYPIHYY